MNKQFQTTAAKRGLLVFSCAVLATALTFLSALGRSQLKPPTEIPNGDAAKGKLTFMTDGCYECHGREAQGSGAGPVLGPSPTPFSKFMTYVRNPTGQMPPYTAKVISDAELADIYAYLESVPEPKPAKSNPLLNH